MRNKFHILRIAVVILGTTGFLAAANFSAPKEGPVPFRRDRIPLDKPSMITLSHELTTLASGLKNDSMAKRRTAAQMLALAKVLDPANAAARELIVAMQTDQYSPTPNSKEIEPSQAHVWQCISWLETPQAGTQGHALADCLLDIIAVSDPANSRSGTLLKAAERGAWDGWVPELAGYQLEQKTENVIPKAHNQTLTNTVKLPLTVITVPMWQRVGEGWATHFSFAPQPLSINAFDVNADDYDHDGSPGLDIQHAPKNNPDCKPSNMSAELENEFGPLPNDWEFRITSSALDDQDLPRNKIQPISGAIAVLVSATLTGNAPGATIVGQLRPNGAFVMADTFWEQIRSINRNGKERVIVPAEAASILMNLLPMGQTEFFLNHEVMIAKNLKELTELASTTLPKAEVEALAKFAEIRSKCGTTPVNDYVKNSFVLHRLVDLSSEAPYLYSAKILASQGAGQGPTKVSRKIIVKEMRQALAPLEWLFLPRTNDEIAAQIGDSEAIQMIAKTNESCSKQIDAIAQYVPNTDSDLVARSKFLIDSISSLQRAASSPLRDANFFTYKENMGVKLRAMMKAHKDMNEALK
jgi:hypothetical protein